MVQHTILHSTVTTGKVAGSFQPVATIVNLQHTTVAGFIITSIGWFSRVGAVVGWAAIQLVKLLDVTLGESGSSANDVLVITVFGHHGYLAVTESGFVVVHDGSVVVGVSEGVDFRGFFEVESHFRLNVVEVNVNEIIAIWSALLVIES